MTPVLQTQFVVTHGKGNCVQAAVASLLDKKIEEVPAFRDAPPGYMDDMIDEYVDSLGLRRIIVRFSPSFNWGDVSIEGGIWHSEAKCRVGPTYAMIFGKSPRGDYGHAIVGSICGSNWRLEHDPHPHANGILGNPTSIHFIVPKMLS